MPRLASKRRRFVSSEEIDELMETTHPDLMIERLTEIIHQGDNYDLSDANLDEKLTEHQTIQVLKTQYLRWPILHSLLVFNPKSAVNLLEKITGDDQFTELIFMKDGTIERNSLSQAVWYSRSDAVRCIYERVSKDNLYKLLKEPDKYGNTALHCASWRYDHFEELFGPFSYPESLALFSLKNNEGQTVLSHFILEDAEGSIAAIMRACVDRKADFLELAALPDNEGKSSFHYAASCSTEGHLVKLIKATLNFSTSPRFVKILQEGYLKLQEIMKQVSWPKPGGANHIIYKWALDSVGRSQYLLFDFPKVIIISNQSNRDGAEEEAETLVKSFSTLGFKVDYKTNQTKRSTLQELKEASKDKHGLIVAIMSHGLEGFILANDGEMIDIKEIEENMTHHSRKTPKCLILQCCQSPGDPSVHCGRITNGSGSGRELPTSCSENEATSQPEIFEGYEGAAGLSFPAEVEDPGPPRNSTTAPRPYSLTSRNMCVFMSSVSGQASLRNVFIPAIAKSILQLRPDEDIYHVRLQAWREILQKAPSQKPEFRSLMINNLCLQNILPLVVKRNEAYL